MEGFSPIRLMNTLYLLSVYESRRVKPLTRVHLDLILDLELKGRSPVSPMYEVRSSQLWYPNYNPESYRAYGTPIALNAPQPANGIVKVNHRLFGVELLLRSSTPIEVDGVLTCMPIYTWASMDTVWLVEPYRKLAIEDLPSPVHPISPTVANEISNQE